MGTRATRAAIAQGALVVALAVTGACSCSGNARADPMCETQAELRQSMADLESIDPAQAPAQRVRDAVARVRTEVNDLAEAADRDVSDLVTRVRNALDDVTDAATPSPAVRTDAQARTITFTIGRASSAVSDLVSTVAATCP
jgi:hypothetical protein